MKSRVESYWKSVEDAAGSRHLIVSKSGIVWTNRSSTNGQPSSWHESGMHPDSKGYLAIYHKRRLIAVAHLVWTSFRGPILPGQEINHKNQDRQDNRLENLELATRAQNVSYRGVFKSSKTGMKGVTPAVNGRFQAYIGTAKNRVYLGIFDSLREAGLAYDKAALSRYGKFAYLNFPSEVAREDLQGLYIEEDLK